MWAPFFGKPAYTMTLAARLAIQNGAVLLPVSCQRLTAGRGYRLKIWPAVRPPESADDADADAGSASPKARLLSLVIRINQAAEAIVLSQPGQYLWGYARYKTPRQEPFAAAAKPGDSPR